MLNVELNVIKNTYLRYWCINITMKLLAKEFVQLKPLYILYKTDNTSN